MISKPHRLSSCRRHPTKPVTGFCASCLRERLAGIESSSSSSSAATHDYPAQPTAQLRRTKSCSGGGSDAPSATIPEPRRRSCEVRVRSSLWDLFSLDDEKKGVNRKFNVDLGNLGVEIREEDQCDSDDAIRVCGDGFVCSGAGIAVGTGEADEETKTMKEFIDLELQSRRNAGSFWEAASILSKTLRKWRRKQKLKKHGGGGGAEGSNGGVGLMGVEVEKPGVRRLRETQSEVGEYGLGRRSCDIDPRLSLDAGRTSLDESRFSIDAPRASWDGYLIGKACPRLSPMVSVLEDAKVPANGIDDNRVFEDEKVNLESAAEPSPGGSAQTKDYYSDSLSWQRRRRSFDRSNSYRKPSMAEVDDLKVISNAKVSPATSELFYGAKVLITEKDLMDTNLKSSNNIQSDCVMGSASKDTSDVVAAGVSQKGLNKFHKWLKVWNKLGLVQRIKEDKLGDGEYAKGDMVNKPFAESWQKLRRAVNGQASESVSQKLIRSYSVSCRNPCRMAGHETKSSVLSGRQEFILQRNRSVRYSPNNLDTGLLRFYLTPLNSYRRSKSGKSSLKDLHPIARNVL